MANNKTGDLKRKVVEALIDHYKATLSSAVQSEVLMTELAQEDENNGADELTSKREEMMGEVEAIDTVLNTNKNRILALSNINLEETSDMVVEGSLVITDADTHYLISTATETIEVDGQKFMGISSEAPIFQEMNGKKLGDTISTERLSFSIKEIQ